MCLAVPGKIVSIENDSDRITATGGSSILRMGRVNFGGIVKEVSLAYVPEARVGDYVIVHVGFAISRLDEKEARRVFDYLHEIGEIKELEERTE
ncbi:MAG TPA: HypC/HybG/HupF family hydrogenase formation chaperone [Nitrospiria bacterium]|nr:HypC/HybG/HupF family hydrogenase formation chaperone [Nitrospiria bacterium]